MNHYHIEFYMEPPIDRWHRMAQFSHLRKSYAEGAWNMLKSFNNKSYRYRLLKDSEVIETAGKATIVVN